MLSIELLDGSFDEPLAELRNLIHLVVLFLLRMAVFGLGHLVGGLHLDGEWNRPKADLQNLLRQVLYLFLSLLQGVWLASEFSLVSGLWLKTGSW